MLRVNGAKEDITCSGLFYSGVLLSGDLHSRRVIKTTDTHA